MKNNILLIILLCTQIIYAQEKEAMTVINPHYSLQIPALDLAKDYGNSSGVGFDFLRLTKNNIIYGIGSQFIFGKKIKNDTLLKHLMDDRNNIFDNNGEISSISLFERGYQIHAKAGYLYPIKNNNGILTLFGLGFIQHKTRIQIENSEVPQLTNEYLKMYDKLTNGLSSNLFLGWLQFSKSRSSNFYAGIDINYAITQNRREYNYFSNGADLTKRKDILYGLKIGWMITISKRSTQKFYYN